MYPILEKAHAVTGQAMNTIMTRSRAQNANPQTQSQVQQVNNEPQHKSSTEDYMTQSGPAAFGGDAQLIGPPSIGFKFTPPGDQNNDVSTTVDEDRVKRTDSEPDLYEGNAWALMYFQRIMLLSLLRLLVFIRKVYEDFMTTKSYKATGQFGFYIVSALTLFAPTIIFTTYRICRYLQQALPKLRKTQPSIGFNDDRQQTSAKTMVQSSHNSSDVNRKLLRSGQQETDVDGLVTARQTPISSSVSPTLSPSPISGDYYEAGSGGHRPASRIACSTRSLPTSSIKTIEQIDDQPKVDVQKLGNLPDPESTRLVIGVGEQIIHGVLYIFWQLKRQVDVVGYLVERACLWRKATPNELRQVEQLRTGSDGLEWFQDFYAAFIAIILQVYTLGTHWRSSTSQKLSDFDSSPPNRLIASQSNQALGSSDSSGAGELLRSTLISTQLIKQPSDDLIVFSEIVVSTVAILSLLIAVRRKDDGSLTMALSMLGWGAIFGARIIIVALGFVHLGWKLMLSLLFVHLSLITIWIYKIAIDSHNDRKSETSAFIWQQQQDDNEEGEAQNPTQTETNGLKSKKNLNTSEWLVVEHVTLIAQILTLFAIPSIFYWPIMFNLRLHCRPLKYLSIILTENCLLILGVLLTIGQSQTSVGQWYLLCATAALTIVGFMFVSLYVCCKPSLTEYFVRADQLFNGAEQAGIYFELCSRVFKMPDLSHHSFTRLLNQSEV